MKHYIYVQAGNVNQCNPRHPDEVIVSFRYVMVSAFSEEGAYVEGQKHVFTAEESGIEVLAADGSIPFALLNDFVIAI